MKIEPKDKIKLNSINQILFAKTDLIHWVQFVITIYSETFRPITIMHGSVLWMEVLLFVEISSR